MQQNEQQPKQQNQDQKWQTIEKDQAESDLDDSFCRADENVSSIDESNELKNP